jgi:hypothetical protein
MPDTDNHDEEAPAWLPERLERAGRTAVQNLLDELGYADANALQDALRQSDERAQNITALEAERATLSEQVTAADAARRQATLDAAFVVEAARYNFFDAGEVRQLADLSAVNLGEDNTVTGMREAIDALVEQRPHLVRRPALAGLDAGTGGASMRPNSIRDFPPEQIENLKSRFDLR